MFDGLFVAYFQGGASKSVHIKNFLINVYLNYSITTKLSEIIWLLIVIVRLYENLDLRDSENLVHRTSSII